MTFALSEAPWIVATARGSHGRPARDLRRGRFKRRGGLGGIFIWPCFLLRKEDTAPCERRKFWEKREREGGREGENNVAEAFFPPPQRLTFPPPASPHARVTCLCLFRRP